MMAIAELVTYKRKKIPDSVPFDTEDDENLQELIHNL